ncbi:hypothetical protein BDV10DRAFT_154909 [Aspergillus recurvatus]
MMALRFLKELVLARSLYRCCSQRVRSINTHILECLCCIYSLSTILPRFVAQGYCLHFVAAWSIRWKHSSRSTTTQPFHHLHNMYDVTPKP